MKSSDEIKKGLKCCNRLFDACHECPYDTVDEGWGCTVAKNADALALIQQKEQENAEQAERIRVLEDHLREATKKVKQLEAERDAAVVDIRLAFTSYVGACQTCKHGENQIDCIESLCCRNCENEKCKCQSCDSYDSNWEWRGVQKEE